MTITEAGLDDRDTLAALASTADAASQPIEPEMVLHTHSVVARRGDELIAAVVSVSDETGAVCSRYHPAAPEAQDAETADGVRRVVVGKACKKLRARGVRAGRLTQQLDAGFWAASRFIQPVDLLPAA